MLATLMINIYLHSLLTYILQFEKIILTNMSTSNENEHIYSVAKKSTLIEAILTCNWFLGFEYYGMSDKKRGFVTFGIGYRIYCVVMWCLSLIVIAFSLTKSGRGKATQKLIMKIVAFYFGFNIGYNLGYKIWHQIKVRKLMKKEEEDSIAMTNQAHP